MIRYLTRDLTAIAAGVAASLTAAPVLLPLRSGWPDADVGLLLAAVVVAVAATGNRVAGGLAVAGAVWFKFFFTLPYERFKIRSSPDVTTFVLLLVVGVEVSQLAARARRLKAVAITDAQIRETASLPQSATAVAEHAREQLTGLPDLQECRFGYGTLLGHPPRLEPDGTVLAGHGRWDAERRACLARRWSCGSSAAASTTGVSC